MKQEALLSKIRAFRKYKQRQLTERKTGQNLLTGRFVVGGTSVRSSFPLILKNSKA
jgi:hypothetical protein